MFISYDIVVEDSSYQKEIEGGGKKPKSLKKALKEGKIKKKRFGKIYIKFHEPISLEKFIEENEYSIPDIKNEDNKSLNNDLGLELMNALNRSSIVTPHSNTSGALVKQF